VITFLLTQDKKSVEKIIKQVLTDMKSRNIKIKGSFLHAIKENHQTRKKLLQLVAQLPNINIISISLLKSKILLLSSSEKHQFYTDVVEFLLKVSLKKRHFPFHQPITFIASRRETNKTLNAEFKRYLETAMKNCNVEMEVLVKPPKEEKGLQVVDFICWAIFQKYERNDVDYYSIIEKPYTYTYSYEQENHPDPDV
jgi:hypothetical protein